MRWFTVTCTVLWATVSFCGCGDGGDVEAAEIARIGEARIATDEQYAYLVDKVSNGGGEQPALAAWSLGRIDRPDAIPVLAAAAAEDSAPLRLNAVGALANYAGAEVREALVHALGDVDEQVVAAALRGLSRPEHAAAAEAIREVVENGSETLRPVAVDALSKMATTQNVPVFQRLAQDRDSGVRSVAAFTLGKLGDPDGVPTLIDLLDDESWEVRANAAQALGMIGDPAARPHLEPLPKDPDQHEQVRIAAELALERLD